MKRFQVGRRWSRCVAAGTALAWMFAFVVCPSLCALRGEVSCHGSKAEVSVCHGDSDMAHSERGVPPCHSTSSDADTGGSGDSSCGCSLGTPTLTAKSVDFKVPELGDVMAPWVLSGAVDSAPTTILVDVNRYVASQTWRDWGGAPELYLGPGLRSLAPPSSFTA